MLRLSRNDLLALTFALVTTDMPKLALAKAESVVAGGVGAIKTQTFIKDTRGLMGGEAWFKGDPQSGNRCIVASSGSRRATPLFDADVMMSEGGRSLRQSGLATVPFGQMFAAGATTPR